MTRVADLTDPATLRRFGIDGGALTSVDMADCQSVGAAIASAGYAAMLVPSARYDGANLVIFGANLAADDAVSSVGAQPVT